MFSHIKELFTRPSGYTIARSVRLRSSASAYFNRTPASNGNRALWTWSAWIKRGTLGTYQVLFGTQLDGGSIGYIGLSTSDTLDLNNKVASSTGVEGNSTRVFRDPSAWYHLVIVFDGNQASQSNRFKIYVNGQSDTFVPRGSLSAGVGYLNTAVSHCIGNVGIQLNALFDGYMTEINFIDGQALTPSSFGSTNALTGVWQPAKYTGTYGTNGFYLNFSDNSSNTATTIGKDYSGNGNNWTPNNISVTAGVTYDSMVDSPTVSAVSSNYAVLNPLTLSGSGYTLSNGNLDISSTAVASVYSTVAVNTGKYYAEFTLTTAPSSAYAYVGVRSVTGGLYVYRSSDGQYYDNSTYSAYGASYTTNDVIGVAIDGVNGTITFYKNGTSQGQKTGLTIVNDTTYYLTPTTTAATGAFSANFGQRPFTYTPPTGFVALNTYNLPASTITNGAAYMAATLYTGTGSALTISNAVNGVSMQPDFIWIKPRSIAGSHGLFDSVRGYSKSVRSNDTRAEDTSPANTDLTAFNSNGFSVGASNYIDTSTNGATVVAWQWKAGGTSSSNTNGSITSTVSVGATQGFSVVTYTGTGANATVGHGLGVAPSMIIIKQRSTTTSWAVYHSGLTSAAYVINLNLTSGQAGPNTVFWNSTAPTSTVFSLGTGTDANASGATAVAYCFAAVAGYSAFGSYTGNGSADGPFVYLGFRPRWVMMKCTNTTSQWVMYDTARDSYNTMQDVLFPNLSNAEENSVDNSLDIVSNGFKFRSGANRVNVNGNTFIYAAFAENPTKYALAR